MAWWMCGAADNTVLYSLSQAHPPSLVVSTSVTNSTPTIYLWSKQLGSHFCRPNKDLQAGCISYRATQLGQIITEILQVNSHVARRPRVN